LEWKILSKVGLAADVIESFVLGMGTKLERSVAGVGVREGKGEGEMEVRGRMGRGGLKGSFLSLLFRVCVVGVWERG